MLDDRLEEVFLTVEIYIEGAFRNSRNLTNVIHTSGVKPPLHKGTLRANHDLIALGGITSCAVSVCAFSVGQRGIILLGHVVYFLHAM